jgi:hypothetical protein
MLLFVLSKSFTNIPFFLQRIMENDPDGMTVSGTDAADPMTQIDSIDPTRPLHRTLMNSESHGVALSQRNNLRSRLHARALFGQHEFAAREIFFRFRQQHRNLNGEHVLTIEIVI